MIFVNGTYGSGLAAHFGKQVRRDRLARGWSVAELARQIGVNPAALGRVENGNRPPTVRLASKLDGVFTDRRGWYLQFTEDARKSPEIPAEFKAWSDFEDRAATLRVWEPGIISGLVQSEGYAAALIATSAGTTEATAQARVRARMERQRRVLHRAEPPRITLLVDEFALYRLVGSHEVMAGAMAHLAQVADLGHVTVQVMPAIGHPVNASGYVLSDDAVWCEHLAAGGVFTDPETVSGIEARHDNLRSECRPASESRARIREVGKIWALGVSPLDQMRTAGTA